MVKNKYRCEKCGENFYHVEVYNDHMEAHKFEEMDFSEEPIYEGLEAEEFK